MTFRFAALLLAGMSLWAADASLTQIKTVYLLPMGNGLDQYLANQLTGEGVFQVVTDPELADAVFTDKLGTAFEQSFAELYPPPPSPVEEAKPEPGAAKKKEAPLSMAALLSDRPDTPVRVSSFSRGRGNLFLVDRRSKRVIWSSYERPRDARPEEVNRVADRLVGRLKDQIGDARKKSVSP